MTGRIAAAAAVSGSTDPIAVMELGAAVSLDACPDSAVTPLLRVATPAAHGWGRMRTSGRSDGVAGRWSRVRHAEVPWTLSYGATSSGGDQSRTGHDAGHLIRLQ